MGAWGPGVRRGRAVAFLAAVRYQEGKPRR